MKGSKSKTAGSADQGGKALTVSQPDVLIDGSDATFRLVVHDLLALSSRLHDINAGFARIVGVSPVQYTILATIFEQQDIGAVTVGKVAEHVHLSGSFVTIETGKLVKKGLVDKTADADDRRRVNLRTTAKADRRFRFLNQFQCPVNNAAFDGITRAEFLSLRDIVAKILPETDRALSLQGELFPLAETLDAAQAA